MTHENTSPSAEGAVSDPAESEIRAALHKAADWIADFLEQVEAYPVLSRSAPGDLTSRLPESPPDQGEPLDALLADVNDLILPGITHWNHPGFMAYFANSGSPPGILGEMLCAALNVNGMLWRTSPAATELEQVSLDWLRQLIGLSDEWQGVIADTASIASFLALAAAREQAGLDIREQGMAGRSDLPAMTIYCSEQAHVSIDKAAIALGIGHTNVRHIEADAQFRMRPGRLAEAIAADREAGRIPLAVCATVGTTSTTSVDPVPEIAKVCAAEGLWLHVDAAYAGSAAVAAEYRWVLDGVNRADSFIVNPHKWLLTPMDCSAFYLRDPAALKRAFSLVPAYLESAEGASASAENYMDWGLQLGRRFRALKLWFVLRHYGAEGLAEFIREHCRIAGLLADWVDAEPGWERLAPAPLSVVCFRHVPAAIAEDEQALSAHNQGIIETVNAEGAAFISHTELNGRLAIRVAVGNMGTRERHVRELWSSLRSVTTATDGISEFE